MPTIPSRPGPFNDEHWEGCERRSDPGGECTCACTCPVTETGGAVGYNGKCPVHNPQPTTMTETVRQRLVNEQQGIVKERFDFVDVSAPPRSRAAQILEDAARTVGAGGDRHRNYGDAADNFTDIGKLWAVILDVEEITAEQVALCMNQVKVARLKNSPNHRDSWVDGVGYLALGGDIASRPGRYL